jgi:PHP family Zn ribbon phosphoesterase
MGITCPVCGKSLTLGVMSRVESLARYEVETDSEVDEFGVRWVKDKKEGKPPFIMLVPLAEIISEALGVGVGTQQVLTNYEQLINLFGSELNVLLKTQLSELKKKADLKVVEGIDKVRSGDIVIEPGYDGVFGKVNIWKRDEKEEENSSSDQATLF